MRIIYEPNSCHEWQEFLLVNGQRGRGITGFRGDPYQRGAGLGSFFRGLFKAAVPLIKRAAKAVGKQALKTGVGVLGDVVRGGEFLPSLELHGREAVGTLADKTKAFLSETSAGQTGGGRGLRRKRTTRKRRSAKKGKKKRKKVGNLSAKGKGKRKRKSVKGKPKRRKRTTRAVPIDIFDNV